MAEGPALEKRYPAKSGIVGSNPTLSAITGLLLGLKYTLHATANIRNNGLTSIVQKSLPYAERCPSWLKEHDWKSCVSFIAAPRVRIPLSPPYLFLTPSHFRGTKLSDR